MTAEELRAVLAEVIGGAEPERVAQIAETVTETFDGLMASVTEGAYTIAELTARNASLQKANADLFLKIGALPADEPGDDPTDEPGEEMTYDNLFDENGGLK